MLSITSLVYFIIVTLYVLLISTVIIKIVMDNKTPAKSLGYLLIVVLIPVAGVIIYLFFGLNFRKKKLYRKKIEQDAAMFSATKQQKVLDSEKFLKKNKDLLKGKEPIIKFLLNEALSPLYPVEKIKLLLNGNEKFEMLLAELEQAKNHIHLEYYIYEDDEIGNKIKDILIRKIKEGVRVRFIYDAFGSHAIKKQLEKELHEAGIEIYPFYSIKFFLLSNRIYYRNHRKIIVIDGNIGFVGGINVGDRYLNNGKSKELFWRDTHLMIMGGAVAGLQSTFIADWNFCSGSKLKITKELFPHMEDFQHDALVQIAVSGPDLPMANIMFSYFAAINSALEKLYITTPYFIPNESILDAIKRSALSGVDVRLLVPGEGDSKFVNAASCSYYEELLSTGVRIFRYQKGFVHAKTITVDDNLSIIGTANMDIRSFYLNFEVNAMVYNKKLNQELNTAFINDIKQSKELKLDVWSKRNQLKKFGDASARLVSSLL